MPEENQDLENQEVEETTSQNEEDNEDQESAEPIPVENEVIEENE